MDTREQSMGSLLTGLNGFLKPADEMENEAGEGQSAMDAAMEAAIEQHVAKEVAGDGEGLADEPSVTIIRSSGANVIFGKRGAYESFR
jgi:hypothetical protein